LPVPYIHLKKSFLTQQLYLLKSIINYLLKSIISRMVFFCRFWGLFSSFKSHLSWMSIYSCLLSFSMVYRGFSCMFQWIIWYITTNNIIPLVPELMVDSMLMVLAMHLQQQPWNLSTAAREVNRFGLFSFIIRFMFPSSGASPFAPS